MVVEPSDLLRAELARFLIQKRRDEAHCCWTCWDTFSKDIQKKDPTYLAFPRMILCSSCGNKRCPKATDHDLACTQSNKPGQEGSVYS